MQDTARLAAAALIAAAFVGGVAAYDRRSGYLAALILLGGIAVYRGVDQQLTELLGAIAPPAKG